MFYKAIVFLPLVGAIAAGLFSLRKLDGAAVTVSIAGVCLSFILSCFAFGTIALGGEQATIDVARWIGSGSFQAHWTLRFDTLTAVMLIVVTGVSSCVHIYSVGYMHNDKSIARFMAYLSLFTFAMLMLVSADNLVQLFFGWEGVGVASYLLIGFWHHKETAHTAAMKAFVVNRVGDFGFVLGILAIFALTGSVSFDAIFGSVSSYQPATISIFGLQLPALEVVSVLLFIGAMGKSAQLGLHTWLPDAMEGPTPVSALLHSATMVTAGVFIIGRIYPAISYSENLGLIISYVGAFTLIFAASMAIVSNDIKKVLAYSSISQLGYMFLALGVGSYGAAFLHLFAHAWFKALLFLGAGSVGHAVHTFDMNLMGGMRSKMKKKT